MNLRKYRSIDFFRTMDRDASGMVSHDEFLMGLKKIGLDPKKNGFNFDTVVEHLDKDGSGDITAEEFDKAAKIAVRKAKVEGREEELNIFSQHMGLSRTIGPCSFSWHHKSYKVHGSLTERSD